MGEALTFSSGASEGVNSGKKEATSSGLGFRIQPSDLTHLGHWPSQALDEQSKMPSMMSGKALTGCEEKKASFQTSLVQAKVLLSMASLVQFLLVSDGEDINGCDKKKLASAKGC
ncbi:hypothetical protein PIB30_099111 [Stylosanthes scabra]|uniref:Uncharacterized protein n=1 Tax=Stylosanthes scabra TaxID=79078 RepID=A0ABU6QY64_9FABA|nr:hypothetical protein [Stylosanthes scabra]